MKRYEEEIERSAKVKSADNEEFVSSQSEDTPPIAEKLSCELVKQDSLNNNFNTLDAGKGNDATNLYAAKFDIASYQSIKHICIIKFHCIYWLSEQQEL